MDKSKSKQCGEERSENERDWIMEKEGKSSDQGEKTPERSKDDPAYASRCGDRLNVTQIESFVAFDQYQLFDEQEVICPQI